MRSVFGQFDITFERFRAVDGTHLPEAFVREATLGNQWLRPLARAELGCFLSHRGCWELIAAGEEPFGVIFEDDMRISPHAHRLLSSWAWIPKNADLIKLETRNRAVTVSRESRQVAVDYELTRLFSFHDGLGGYIVSKQCARLLCSQAQKPVAPVDQLVLNPSYGIFANLNVFQLTPAICIPEQIAHRDDDPHARSITSTIDPDGILYQSDGALLRVIRKRKRARRELAKLADSVRRLLSGKKRIRVPYR